MMAGTLGGRDDALVDATLTLLPLRDQALAGLMVSIFWCLYSVPSAGRRLCGHQIFISPCNQPSAYGILKGQSLMAPSRVYIGSAVLILF